ncbi:hypothetical protein ANN_23396 [Periplaneta americana]|uniref:UDP-glucuronosyltransferase n=1 Tax=Periplaneta americana TaxID=6978 RepID=A0ABQ8SM60_PERAM|nr:hypothetical protein ANN_23396 [Periplaneta americana]
MKLHGLLFFVVLLGSYSIDKANAARILAMFELHIKSHFIMFEALLKGLAAKGHEVVVVSHFPQKNPIPNYTDISIEGALPSLLNSFTIQYAVNQKNINLLHFVWNLNIKFCEKSFEHPKVQELIKSKQKFDLVITEYFGANCFTGFAHLFNASHINVASSMTFPWIDEKFGNPSHPAYIPIFFLPHTDKMNLQQRVYNTIMNLILKFGSYYFSELPMEQLARKHLGNQLPPLREISKNTSLVLVNSHFSINIPRPMVPGVIEVGGLHIGTPKKLPRDIEKYISGANHGVIYFSLGSLVRSETFSEEIIRSFLDAFAELPQRVIWKTDTISGLPDNVMTSKWLPQFDILSHPNVRVFITHGGFMGTQEAIYSGVPMVGIPFYSDQHHNIENCVSKGIGVKLDYHSISKESVLLALRAILENPDYERNAKRLSQQFRDRPQSALDTAIFWTEYVIRHRGAPHLRSAAADLPWYQYFLLDVVTVLLIIVVSLISVIYVVIRILLKIFSGLNRRKTSKSKRD